MVIQGPWRPRPWDSLSKDEQTLRLIAAFFIMYPSARDRVYESLICIREALNKEAPAL
jgi:hypothetical protein